MTLFVCRGKARTLPECSVLVGVGFAVLENAFIPVLVLLNKTAKE